jgi:hypothetical protein
MDMITKIVMGCTKDVYRYYGPESQWRSRVRELLKPSKEHLVQLLSYRTMISSGTYFNPKDIERKFSEEVGDVDHATVSRSLKKFTKVKVLQSSDDSNRRLRPGRPGRNDRINPGPRSSYSISSSEAALREFVSRIVPRGIIYGYLYESDVLMQFLKFHHYSTMMRCKYGNMKEFEKSLRAASVLDTKSLNETTSQHLAKQTFLRQKSDKDITRAATWLAKEDLIKRNWEDDELYTQFFIRGGRCYEVIEESNL